MRTTKFTVGIAIGLVLATAGSALALTSSISPANLFKIGGTQIVPIYPTWSVNIPLSQPTNFAAASSTSPGGSLSTSSAPIYFEVVAINSTGTTTVSTELSTTTKTGSSRIHFSWTAVPGATGYAIFYSTTTPGAENAYQLATTSNQYDFTSTSSPSYATPPGFASALALQLSNGTNPLIVNGISVSPVSTTTSAVGGGALTAGQCTTATSTLTLGTVSSSTVVQTTPQKYPGSGFLWQSYALNSTQIVTQVCALANGTPVSTQYNIRAF